MRVREYLTWLDNFRRDVRHVCRGLQRAPGFAVAVILTLGLGIGVNAAIFGVVDRLMFRPLPYLRDPGSVDRVYLRTEGWNRGNAYSVFPYARFLDFRESARSFSHFAAFVTATHGVGSGESARKRTVHAVSAGAFDFFQARPALGRFFVPGDDSLPRGANVAVLAFEFWRSELGSRDVIGDAIQIGNATYTIVGVAPEGFVGFSEAEAPAVFIPIAAYGANEGGGNRDDFFRTYNWDWAQMVVRRRPGVERAEASTDLTRAFIASWDASRVVNPGFRPASEARPRAVAGAVRRTAGPDAGLESRTLLWITGVSSIVLLIACANVANLFLARALRRQRQVALQLALGVSRARLASQILIEALVLALLGCITGLLLAHWGRAIMRRLFIPGATALDVFADWRTWTVALLAALLAALVCSFAPMLFSRRTNVAAVLKAGSRDLAYQGSVARTVLLVTQGALSVILLIGAGLFVRSLHNVKELPLGYDLDRLLLVEWERRGTPMDSAARAGLRQRMLAAALARTDVERAAWVSSPPFATGTSTMSFTVPGVDSVGRLGRFAYQIASADYFATAGTGIIRGRGLGESDRADAPPVVVVSQAMAAALWPAQEPLGKCMRIAWSSARPDTMPCVEVVGVAENAVHDPASDLPLRYYVPEAQADFGTSTLLLRMRLDPAAAAEDVRRSLQAGMPGLTMVTVRPAAELFDARRRSWRVGATVFVALGALALVVAAVGVYGVVAYTVSQRMHEMGVRVALGARSVDVVRLVMGQGLRFATAGVAAGILIALASAPWIQPLLFEQSATDPVVYGLVAMVLLLIAFVASAAPAWRAMRADPNAALRME